MKRRANRGHLLVDVPQMMMACCSLRPPPQPYLVQWADDASLMQQAQPPWGATSATVTAALLLLLPRQCWCSTAADDADDHCLCSERPALLMTLVDMLQEGIPDDFDVVYVGSLSVDVDIMEQEVSRQPLAPVAPATCQGQLQ